MEMNTQQTIGFSAGVAKARRQNFLAIYRVVLGVEAFFGLLLLLIPHQIAALLAFPHRDGYPIWGAMMIACVLLQIPGLVSPIHARLSVVAGVVTRAFLAVVYLVLALWGPAIITVVFAILLARMFSTLVYAELGNRP